MRIVAFGSGSFGVPTLAALALHHEIALVVTQPSRPAGRGRALTPTPVAAWASERGLPVRAPLDVNQLDEMAAIHAIEADAWVVIAFGQKLSRALLGDAFAINLHGSLLPAYRGAAPINWAMIDGCATTGVTVIALADRMDAGLVYGTASTPIDPAENAAELHDRLALLGPPLVLDVLARRAAGTLVGVPQDESKATRARKFTKADGRLDLAALDAHAARCRIHGMTPWPGCDVLIDGRRVRLLRVRDHASAAGEPGTIGADGRIACARGALEVLELQPEGGRAMTVTQCAHGRGWEAGMAVAAVPSPGSER